MNNCTTEEEVIECVQCPFAIWVYEDGGRVLVTGCKAGIIYD